MAFSISHEMVVDTGSNVTVLSGELADRLGIDVAGLERRNLGGVTGVARRPFVHDVEIFLGGLASAAVRLPLAAIATPDILRQRGEMAAARWKSGLAGGSVSILGMDIARALRARLSLDFATLTGTLEW